MACGWKRNVNRSRLEAILDPRWAVCGVFVLWPSGRQTELSFPWLSSVWLFGRDFHVSTSCTEGHVGEHGLSPNMLAGWVQSLVGCSFDIFIFAKIPHTSQLDGKRWCLFSEQSALDRKSIPLRVCLSPCQCMCPFLKKLMNVPMSRFSTLNDGGRIFTVYLFRGVCFHLNTPPVRVKTCFCRWVSA